MDLPCHALCASHENCCWWPFGTKTDGRGVCTDLSIYGVHTPNYMVCTLAQNWIHAPDPHTSSSSSPTRFSYLQVFSTTTPLFSAEMKIGQQTTRGNQKWGLSWNSRKHAVFHFCYYWEASKNIHLVHEPHHHWSPLQISNAPIVLEQFWLIYVFSIWIERCHRGECETIHENQSDGFAERGNRP